MVKEFTLNQSEYTQLFLQASGSDLRTVDVSSFWWNKSNPYHLRLSTNGISFVKNQTNLPIYQIHISHPLLSTHLIKLARLNIGPYYLHTKTKNSIIIVLKQEVATMLTLHAGNLGQYLENLQL